MTDLKPIRAMPLWALLVGTLLLITLAITYGGGEVIRAKEMSRLMALEQEQIESSLTLVASSIADAVVVQDIPVLTKVINEMNVIAGGIHRVRITNDFGQMLLNWVSPKPVTGELKKFSREIRRGTDQYFGKVFLVWDNGDTIKEITEEIEQVRINIAFFMVITGLILLVWMHVIVISPVMQINQRLVMGSASEPLNTHWWTARELRRLKQSVTRLEEVTISKDELENEVERRKDAEITLLGVRDEALKANRAKSTFLANMSHELRTPLNAIIGYSEMILEDARSHKQDDYVADLEKVHIAGRHLLALINEVLDLSKIEAGKMDLHIEAFDLSGLIRAIVSTVEPMARKNSNTINLTGIEAVLVIKSDLTKVRQILFNLLSNAIKFTEHGEIHLTIEDKTLKNIEGIQIKVSDSGIGISQEAIDNLFQPFQQADISTTRKYGGTGLGLALCLNFSEMMNGKIWLESEPGNGSTFYVWLPKEVVVNKGAGEKEAVQSKHIKQMDPKTVRLPEGIKSHLKKQERRRRVATVLTIDDDPNVLELMSRVYNREGFRAVSASSGEMGIDLARKLKPDLITLDIMMPGMDGWEVLRFLKEDDELQDIPVIMVSIVENKPMALDVGALASLTKPIAWDRLLDLTRMSVRDRSTIGAVKEDTG